MKKIFKIGSLVLIVGVIITTTIILSTKGTKAKIVVLGKEELKTKAVALATAPDKDINRYDIDNKNFTGYLLEVTNPRRIKVGYSKDLGKDGETTSNIAKDNNAIAAINGGLFSEVPINPYGIILTNGEIIRTDSNEVNKIVGFNKDGILIMGNYNPDEVKNIGIQEGVSYLTSLIENGIGMVTNDKYSGINPRTVIGQKKDGTVVLLAVDGRQITKVGATSKEVQDIMLEHDVYNAVELDGGSSTTMYYEGALINNPCGQGAERKVASIFYVTK